VKLANAPRSGFVAADGHRDDVPTAALAKEGDRLFPFAPVETFGQRKDLCIRSFGGAWVPWAVMGSPSTSESPSGQRLDPAVSRAQLKENRQDGKRPLAPDKEASRPLGGKERLAGAQVPGLEWVSRRSGIKRARSRRTCRPIPNAYGNGSREEAVPRAPATRRSGTQTSSTSRVGPADQRRANGSVPRETGEGAVSKCLAGRPDPQGHRGSSPSMTRPPPRSVSDVQHWWRHDQSARRPYSSGRFRSVNARGPNGAG
jgi:hypothetical protein